MSLWHAWGGGGTCSRCLAPACGGLRKTHKREKRTKRGEGKIKEPGRTGYGDEIEQRLSGRSDGEHVRAEWLLRLTDVWHSACWLVAVFLGWYECRRDEQGKEKKKRRSRDGRLAAAAERGSKKRSRRWGERRTQAHENGKRTEITGSRACNLLRGESRTRDRPRGIKKKKKPSNINGDWKRVKSRPDCDSDMAIDRAVRNSRVREIKIGKQRPGHLQPERYKAGADRLDGRRGPGSKALSAAALAQSSAGSGRHFYFPRSR